MPTETPPVTDDVFIAAIRAAVAERGADYVYPREVRGWATDSGGCRYVTYAEAGGGKQAACLIGAALHKAGIPLGRLARYDGKTTGKNAYDLLSLLAPSTTIRVRLAAGAAQCAQDDDATWGHALAMFEAHLQGI